MSHNPRLQPLQHLILQVVVILKQALFSTVLATGCDGGCVHLGVVVDGDAVDVVEGADEVVDHGRGGEGLDMGGEGRPDELGLKADEDVDL